MKSILLMLVISLFFHGRKIATSVSTIGHGQMPNISVDSKGIHLIYGTGDSIMYSSAVSSAGKFSSPVLLAVLPKLAAAFTRGPQIASGSNGLLVTACNNDGDIFSYINSTNKKWQRTARVNDKDTVAKENLMGLAADGSTAFAVWVDLRDNHNKIYGAASADGGKSWSKNILVYASPENTVCECCKPSVAIRDKHVVVMFRNLIKGNRDLYIIESTDGGKTFGKAEKLGNGSWALNGCPMDGGSVVIDKDDHAQTIWNRKGKIYSCTPGTVEKELGAGKGCTIANVDGQNVYAWIENGELIILKPDHSKLNMGKGKSPVIKAIDKQHIICVWENDKKIQQSIVEI